MSADNINPLPLDSAGLTNFIREQRDLSHVDGLPLRGKRVLDVSTVIAAPFAAALLGDAGAEVIKIENPHIPDALRQWSTCEDTGIEPFHAVIGRNKLPVTINLKADNGKRIFLDLIKESDILIENLRVGAMSRLGLSHDDLLEINPGLIIGKISGYGMTGPMSRQPGFGTLAEAFSGFTHLNGYPEKGPSSPPNALADMTAGTHLAFAISLALLQQERGIRGGQVIDTSLYEPLFSYLGGEFLSYRLSGENPAPLGNELRSAAPRNLYQTKDGGWVALSCSSQSTWEKLAHLMNHAELIDDPRFLSNNDRIKPQNRAALNAIIQAWHDNITEQDALDLFQREGITAGPVKTMNCIDTDPQYAARESFAIVTDPVSGLELKMPNVPYRMTGQPTKIRFPGLPHGSANYCIYKDLLGYTDEMLSEFKQVGTI